MNRRTGSRRGADERWRRVAKSERPHEFRPVLPDEAEHAKSLQVVRSSLAVNGRIRGPYSGHGESGQGA
jgi:hypothetical protein